MFFFFKQKTAYEMRISDWSSDVCSSDLLVAAIVTQIEALAGLGLDRQDRAPRRLGEARLRLESIKRTREEGESEALAGGSIVQRLLEYALAVVSQAPAERQFPDRLIGSAHVCNPVTHAPLVCRLSL